MAICKDTRKCFARSDISKECKILTDTKYYSNSCPFCKPKMGFTNDKYYPYDASSCKETKYEKLKQ